MNVLFPLLAVLIWSVNAIVIKMSSGAIDPAAISFYRWLLALVILTPFVLAGVIRNRRIVIQQSWRLLVLGLLGMVLYQSLAYYAAHSVTALFIGILNSLIPLLTVLFSIAVLRVAPTLGVLLGTLISFSGLLWLVSQGRPLDLLTHGIGAGEVMMIVASSAYALYGVLTKRWAIALSNWQSLYVQIFFGVLMLLPSFLLAPGPGLNTHNASMVAFAGIGASLLAPYLWIQGVMRLGANTASIFMNLAPLFTAVIAVCFLHEGLHSYHLVGGGVTLLGVILAQRLRMPLFRGRREQKMPS